MPTTNAAAIRDVLGGEPGPFRDIVLLNAAAALIVGGKAADLQEGVERAARAIDNGAARLRSTSWSPSPTKEPNAVADILDKITCYKLEEIARAKEEQPLQVVAEYARSAAPGALLRWRDGGQAQGRPAQR